MSEVPPEQHEPAPPPATEGEPELMPRWVPVAIGVVLVTLAALAVITGLRYRDDTLVDMMDSRRMPQASAAPPGEPEAGASRMMSNRGANVPAATAAAEEETHSARRGMMVQGAPEDAVVYVNDVPVARARELDTENEVYDFAEAGSYTVRIIEPAGAERRFVITVSQDASRDIAVLDFAAGGQ